MCSCDMGVVCSQCQDTPFDPRYLEDAHEPMDTAEFDGLALFRRSGPPTLTRPLLVGGALLARRQEEGR